MAGKLHFEKEMLSDGGKTLLITRETDYALRILRALKGGTQVTTGDICRQELISIQFAYKILKKLKGAGLISIARGTDGGCKLAADLNQVSLYDLIQIMDGDNHISACMHASFQCGWHMQNEQRCNIHNHLTNIQNVLDQELKEHSLYSMLCE